MALLETLQVREQMGRLVKRQVRGLLETRWVMERLEQMGLPEEIPQEKDGVMNLKIDH